MRVSRSLLLVLVIAAPIGVHVARLGVRYWMSARRPASREAKLGRHETARSELASRRGTPLRPS